MKVELETTEGIMLSIEEYNRLTAIESHHRDLVAAVKELLNTQVGTNAHGDALNILYEISRKALSP